MTKPITWILPAVCAGLAGGVAAVAETASSRPSDVKRSLDEIDRESYSPGPSPWDLPAGTVSLAPGTAGHPRGAGELLLDGQWQMAEEGDEPARLAGDWNDAMPARVPGSVHAALLEAGKIPDPRVGRNDALAREKSFRTWWFRRVFNAPKDLAGARLVFDGVAIHCTVWLNGQRLGEHEGMFGGPSFDVGDTLQEDNELVVRLNPAPYEEGTDFPSSFFKGRNVGWTRTVVFNNVWGWHYCDIPALGIWRSVRIEGSPAVRVEHPFVATRDAQKGEMGLVMTLRGGDRRWSGRLVGTIAPDNFDGEPLRFEHAVQCDGGAKPLHLRFRIPGPRLWWPNGLGGQNLYRLTVSFVPDGGGTPDTRQTTFGIRTIEMAPLPGGPYPDRYNWTFVVNGRPMFVKGTNWCTMDPLMDFSRGRIDRLVTLAKDQHVQMFRCWGSGMPETDEFYDACDRAGIMVLQEWPTAWNSHERQPCDVLEETVRLNTLRLRNHPALVMWGAGNESDRPFGRAIDMMGRYAVELDGTRAFHRAEGWGGSVHSYACWWGREPLAHNLTMTADFFGEFGLASVPVLESVRRYLPAAERDVWPPPPDGSFAYHTPVFNTMEDMDRLTQYAGGFTAGRTMAEFITGSQLAQAVGVRHTLERARTRWPACSGALYYKMNDNYPAASWSCVDWYGAPKIGHFVFQDTFAPLHACLLFEQLNYVGRPMSLPVFLLDDADALRDAAWDVTVRAYDHRLREIRRESYAGRGPIDRVRQIGVFSLTEEQTDSIPLLLVVDLRRDSGEAGRTFYFVNYEPIPDGLFQLPATEVGLRAENGRVVVKNEGHLPAVAVSISRPGHADAFRVEDSFFWLDAGESRSLAVSETDGVIVEWWNHPGRPSPPADREPPRVAAVVGRGASDTVSVRFSEVVARAAAVDAGNYTLDGGAVVRSASLESDARTVRLTVSPLTAGQEYTLTVEGISDRATEPNRMAGPASMRFTAQPSFVGHWAFNEGCGDTAADSSPAKAHGRIHGARWVSGPVGTALEFDGQASYVEVAADAPDIGARFTLAAWVRPGRSGVYRMILAKGRKTTGHYEIYIAPDDRFRFYAHEMEDIDGGFAVPTGQWTHVAVTCDGQRMRFFRDGTPVREVAVAPRISDVSAPLMIGSLVDRSFPFAGAIDEVVIHRRALSEEEIRKLAAPVDGTRIVPAPQAAAETRWPVPVLRLPVRDQGIVMRYGDGPDRCDELGARDVWVWEHQGTYYMHYDGAGPKGWLVCLATSSDLVHWEKKGPVLDLGPPGSDDSATASYGTTFFDGRRWHMFYLGSPRASDPPDRVPIGPYLTMKAEADSPTGPWRKRPDFVTLRPRDETGPNASPGLLLGSTSAAGLLSSHWPGDRQIATASA